MSHSEPDCRLYDHLAPGDIAFGRYSVIETLGSGATSVVYCCRDVCDGTVLALKVLTSEAARDPVVVSRFRNEIHACYRIRHNNVLRVMQFFRVPGCEAYTMEHVQGWSLAELVTDSEPLPFALILNVLRQLTSGLAAIHRAGVIHRDIKPDNVLITEAQEVKICDFNTALCKESSYGVGDDGQIGTLEYMSPEVLLDGRADERSDIFSLGVLAYELVTGKLPFAAASAAKHASAIQRERYTDIRKLRKDCPGDLERRIRWMLSPAPANRPGDAVELLAELERVTLTSKKRATLVGRLLKR